MLIGITLLAVGLGVLIFGAEMMVKGAVQLSHRFGIPLVVIGLTVVAFGTSAPEFAVCIISALQDKTDMALGNVFGSNLFNTLVVLGVASIIIPSQIHSRFVKSDVPVMVLAGVFAFLFSMDRVFSPTEGWIFFGGLIAFLLLQYLLFRSDKSKEIQDEVKDYLQEDAVSEEQPKKMAVSVMFLFFGMFGLGLGSHWFVEGATEIALLLGIDELTIGMSVLAFGTSLPELATSVMAAIRKQSDIVVGNVIGSNIFNLLGVLGLTAALSPQGLSVSALTYYFDLPFLVLISLSCIPIFWTGFKIYRWEGICFLGAYLIYSYFVFNRAALGGSLKSFELILSYAGLPFLILIFASLIENLMSRKNRSAE